MQRHFLIRFRVTAVGLFILAAVVFLFGTNSVNAQASAEYRAYWVETFNSQLGTRIEIDRVINSAVDSNANAIFAQVRRRGDSWYLDTLEPLTQVAGVGEPATPGGPWTIDPLAYLIQQAHLRGIEVHAFVIIGSIYNAHPTITGLPRDPKHAFNTNFWDRANNALFPVSDPRQWSTRSLPHNLDGTTFNGQRYGAEWYVDLGHPDAAAYTANVLTHLVTSYDLDGLHLDRIRYPEAPIDRQPGQPLGINTGYNETSVARFRARYGDAASYYQTSDIGTNVNTAAAPRLIGAGDVGYPKTTDPLWSQWRRDQVSNFVRRLYLNITKAKPRVKVSAALICFWTGPVGSGGWERTEAYYRVFQDWRAWAQEGTLDILAPMDYKREHITPNTSANEQRQFDDWLKFTKDLAVATGRHSVPGLGNYLNGVEGSLRQARRVLARPPFDSNNQSADGIIFYALGNTVPGTLTGNSTSVAITANPFSYPVPNLNTPKRTNADFFAALRTGSSANLTVRFEDLLLAPLFPTYVPTPPMPWKSAPTLGHLMGFAKRADDTPLDTATVTITNLDDNTARNGVTDGGGFYGGVGMAPGQYLVKAVLGNDTLYSCVANVSAGTVTTANVGPETVAPVTTAALTPAQPNGTNGWYTSNVDVALAASDACSGVANTEYSLNGGQTWTAYTGAITLSDDRVHTISYRSTDRAGNVEVVGTQEVKIDKTAPTARLSASPSRIFPPDGRQVTVTLTGTGSDATSGLYQVSYSVTDEYGTPLSIATRSLVGSDGRWTDSVNIEARRNGDDLDGRVYHIVATVTDAAGNTTTASVDVTVAHDMRPQ